jgi:hypothetical protein
LDLPGWQEKDILTGSWRTALGQHRCGLFRCGTAGNGVRPGWLGKERVSGEVPLGQIHQPGSSSSTRAQPGRSLLLEEEQCHHRAEEEEDSHQRVEEEDFRQTEEEGSHQEVEELEQLRVEGEPPTPRNRLPPQTRNRPPQDMGRGKTPRLTHGLGVGTTRTLQWDGTGTWGLLAEDAASLREHRERSRPRRRSADG